MQAEKTTRTYVVEFFDGTRITVQAHSESSARREGNRHVLSRPCPPRIIRVALSDE